MARKTRKAQIDPTMQTLAAAIQDAQAAADETMIPQTVYEGENTHGWASTWNGARCVANAKRVHVTMLPARYFS